MTRRETNLPGMSRLERNLRAMRQNASAALHLVGTWALLLNEVAWLSAVIRNLSSICQEIIILPDGDCWGAASTEPLSPAKKTARSEVDG